MAHSVRRDLFTRGVFERASHGPGNCAWCGQKRKRVFTYVWVSDGAPGGKPSIFHRHQADHAFCNIGCFESYHT